MISEFVLNEYFLRHTIWTLPVIAMVFTVIIFAVNHIYHKDLFENKWVGYILLFFVVSTILGLYTIPHYDGVGGQYKTIVQKTYSVMEAVCEDRDWGTKQECDLTLLPTDEKSGILSVSDVPIALFNINPDDVECVAWVHSKNLLMEKEVLKQCVDDSKREDRQ